VAHASSIFLIGPMGSGKSAVGKRLAARLHRAFHDTDSEIERRTGVDVAYVFEREGEAGFGAAKATSSTISRSSTTSSSRRAAAPYSTRRTEGISRSAVT
jgi:shikimate kinase